MKKIGTSILMLFMISVSLIACSQSTNEDPEKKLDEILAQIPQDAVTTDNQTESKPPATIEEEIDNYVNVQLPKLWAIEESAIMEFYSATGEDYVNDASVYQSLVNVVLPTYKEFVDQIKGLKTYSKEVEEAHQLYINAASEQYEALEIMKKRLEEGDANYLDAAAEKIIKASEGFSNWQTAIKNLAEKYHVTIAESEAANTGEEDFEDLDALFEGIDLR